MAKFKEFCESIVLSEAVRAKDAPKMAKLILSYLNKKLGKTVLYPSIEQFKWGGKLLSTMQFVVPSKSMIIRFNWERGTMDERSLYSVTIQRSVESKDLISFDKKVSLARSLPYIVDIIKTKQKGQFDLFLGEGTELEEDFGLSYLNEAVEDPLEMLRSHVTKLSIGDKFTASEIGRMGGTVAYRLASQLISDNKDAFEKRKLVVMPSDLTWKGVEKVYANSRVSVKVKKDTTPETWVKPAELSGMESQVEEQITYIEKVEDLSNMIKFMLKGASNAVFVAGRGGTGKTQTVEDTLAELGKTDGNGYYKVTGSASPSAVYEVLYRNHDGIVLFDDSDGALDSQDGRNIIKAATDTKEVRKVSWLKKGGAYYDPEFGNEEDDPDLLPRYFEFTGKVIFISNLGMRKLDPDGALRTRAMMIELNPTNMEIYEFMGLIYDKIKLSGGNTLSKEKRKEVVDELRDMIKRAPENTVNLRLLVRALNLAATGIPEWRRMLRYV